MFTEKQINLFWSNIRVGQSDECWNWKLVTDRYGYGKVRIGGVVYIAHRVAFEIANGFVPAGKHVLHKCDNSICCNPLHLYAGTHLDNMHDMTARNRRARGGKYPQKMSLEKANVLREEFKLGASKHSLARKYDISPKSVRDIIRGVYWKIPSSPLMENARGGAK